MASYEIIMHCDERKDFDGVALKPEHDVKFTIPFYMNQIVWQPILKRKKWCVKKQQINGVWCTNCCGVQLSDETYISSDKFHTLFETKEDAIKYCLEKNNMNKVKVYGENNWLVIG